MQVSKKINDSYSKDLELIKRVVYKAGQIAKDAFLKNKPQIFDKGGGHEVTSADIAVNNYLSKYLKKIALCMGGYQKKPRTITLD